MPPPAHPARRRARRLLRRHRRPLGAVLLGLGTVLAVHEVRPAPPPTQQVVAAARDLPGGLVLTADDLVVRDVPVVGVPAGALAAVDQVVDEVLAGPVLAGEALTPARLRGPGLLTGRATGEVALPVRLADPEAAALLRSGDRIDLYATVPGDASSQVTVVATDLSVLLATEVDATAPGLAAAGAEASGGVVVVAVSPAQARTIIGAAADAPLWFTLQP